MLALLYRFLTDAGAPAIDLYLKKRRADGREDRYRFRERYGFASKPRLPGRMIWCHAASVGEAASLLALIDKIIETYPGIHVVVTTGTITSARMLEKRLPQGAVHQYVPVDRAAFVKRFLDHWRPDLALWVESELWPNTLAGLKVRMIPAVLLNGRISEKSFRNWYRFRGWARQILSAFDLCLVQTEEAKGRFVALGAGPVRVISNLKYTAKPLPVDAAAFEALKGLTAMRNVWGMISTHRGEEEMAITAHRHLRTKLSRALTVIVPRHAVRGDEIEQRLKASGIPYARRSTGVPLTDEVEIYLADTMGELGLFYRLCPVIVLGGSFVPLGGHNPVEPAQLGTAIVFGPSMFNFSAVAKEFVNRKAALQLKHGNEIGFTLERLLGSIADRLPFSKAAQILADEKRHVLDDITSDLKTWLDRKPAA